MNGWKISILLFSLYVRVFGSHFSTSSCQNLDINVEISLTASLSILAKIKSHKMALSTLFLSLQLKSKLFSLSCDQSTVLKKNKSRIDKNTAYQHANEHNHLFQRRTDILSTAQSPRCFDMTSQSQ